jgi:hypothetical protein
VTGGIADVFNAELGASKTARWRSNSSSLSLSVSLLGFESAQSGSDVFDLVLGAEIRPGGHGHFNLTTGESNSV